MKCSAFSRVRFLCIWIIANESWSSAGFVSWFVCVCVCVCVCVFSHIWRFATPWIVACQAYLSMEWVAISYSRGSSWPRDRICIFCVSCIGSQILYHCATWEAWIWFREASFGLIPQTCGRRVQRHGPRTMRCWSGPQRQVGRKQGWGWCSQKEENSRRQPAQGYIAGP